MSEGIRNCYYCGQYISGQSHTCNTSDYTKGHMVNENSVKVPQRELTEDRLKLGFAMLSDNYED